MKYLLAVLILCGLSFGQGNNNNNFGGGSSSSGLANNNVWTGTNQFNLGVGTGTGSGAAGYFFSINGTAPTLTANSFGLFAPTTITTAYGYQMPSAECAAAGFFALSAPTAHVNTVSCGTFSGNTTVMQTAAADVHAASAGVALCADGSGNSTTTGCAAAATGVKLLYNVGATQTPATPTVTPTCTGTCVSTWGYKIVAFDAQPNQMSIPSAQGSTALNAATLDSTHKNTISWTALTGASTYNVYRTASGGTPANLSLVCTGVTQVAGCVDDGTVNTASATPGVYTGTAANLTVFTYAVPANTIPAGKCIRATVTWKHTTGSASTTYLFSFGTNGIGASSSNVSIILGQVETICNNAGVTNSQYGIDSGNIAPTSVSTYSADTTGIVSLLWRFNVAATDAVTFSGATVELLQ